MDLDVSEGASADRNDAGAAAILRADLVKLIAESLEQFERRLGDVLKLSLIHI